VSVFLEWGPVAKTYFSDGRNQNTGFYIWRASGSRGSISRKRPASLLTSPTGHSVNRSEHQARNYSPPVPQPWYPGTVFTVSTPAQNAVGDAVGTGLLSPDDIASLVRTADGKLLARLKGMNWNAAVSLAELGETARFVASTAKELFDYYKLARKGDLLGLANLYHNRDARGKRRPPFPERVTNRYLAFRFAVRPIVSDLEAVLDDFHSSGVKPAIQLVTAKAEAHQSAFRREPDYQGNPALPIHYIAQDDVTVRRGVYFTVSPDLQRWKSLGFTNLASVLWELTPYSFMVDRILPIGQFINSLDAAIGVGVVMDWRAQKRTGSGTRSIADGFVRTKTDTYSRSVQLGLPSPVLPRISPSGGVPVLTDALALLYQLKNRAPHKGF